MNHVILVGRLTETPQLTTIEDQTRMVTTLAVPRTFRNHDGIYETDFIRCLLWNGIAKKTKEYCQKGDIVCMRGRLQIRNYETKDLEKRYITEVVVESIAFVASSQKHSSLEINEEENEEKTY